MPKPKLSDREIEELYDSGDFRLTQERSDFLLPQIQDFVTNRKWINLRPEYQRRLVWTNAKKSLLVESLLMNVPIPPVFLFEHDLSRYEVMDGQQRLNAIVEFYENRLKLSGLEKWSVLNGRTYADCPPRIRRGLDRRRLSATVLLAESGKDEDQVTNLRRMVFERLNTGGQNLNAQELRNAIYSGSFNELLIKLAGTRLFNEIWEIPPYEDNIRGDHISASLLENHLYRRMMDCEYVLRFFAFGRRSKLRGSVQKILDEFMREHQFASQEFLQSAESRFIRSLELAREIFADEIFLARDEKRSVPLYDAVMIGLDHLYEHRSALTQRRADIVSSFKKLLDDDERYEIVVGRPNTAAAIKDRLDIVENLLREYI